MTTTKKGKAKPSLEKRVKVFIESLKGKDFFVGDIAMGLDADYREVAEIVRRLGKEGLIEPSGEADRDG